jgi:hypothetical protein
MVSSTRLKTKWQELFGILPESCTNYLLRLEAPRNDTWRKIQVAIQNQSKERRFIDFYPDARSEN